ncbi:DUF4974 domain-containing protein [Flavobacteriaceae bacterium F08102]|nr:DUF4974 domain-containing protein [Flavobacteriaceae bacterium F08102]
MITDHIEILIIKYCTNQISTEEIVELTQWVKQDDNLDLFSDFIKVNFTLEELKMTTHSNSDVWKVIKKHIQQPRVKNAYWKYAVAASVLALISLVLLLPKKESETPVDSIVTKNTIESGTDKAILTLSDGSTVALEKGSTYATDNLKSDGEVLVYSPSGEVTERPKIAYNYLTVPRGGEFFLQLADKTRIWMNSESKLKYPVEFIDGETRHVELVYGEAYFEVSKSSAHKGSKFIVGTKVQDVEVLGTEFNIKAYDGNDYILTTLVEGKIAVTNGVALETLTPGLQSKVSIKDDNISLSKVDVTYETAWKNGLFVFENDKLGDIMVTLSRWYDVDVIFTNMAKKEMVFSGKLPREGTINNILSKIEQTGDVKFTITDKLITVN